MARYCFLGHVDPANLEEYRARHADVWPELLVALRDADWRNYSLFLRPDGLLIGYAESDDLDEAQRRVAATAVNARWQAEMARLFGAEGAPDEAWEFVPEVFNLEGQLARAGEAAEVGDGTGAAGMRLVNTHVHVPPNFSAFADASGVIEAAVAQGVRAVGISNFFDQQVYARFASLAADAGVVALFGLEFITLDPELAAAGIRINDPANPGRMYLCGKGIDPFRDKPAAAAATAQAIRSGNDARATAMVAQLAAHFASAGFDTGLTAASIAAEVARRGDVPVEWVSLQERHVAQAFQEALAVLPVAERAEVLARAYGGPTAVDLDDPAKLQGELRSRLIKVGTPGFVPEVPLDFADAYAYVLAMGGIPTYPTLADGVAPVCPFEDPAAELAQQLLQRRIYAAELIPIRNTSACVDAYVKAFTDAGIIVMGGTEHNTAERIPLEVTCADGALSDEARLAFWEATCVVAAHQHLVKHGEPGFVDEAGNPVGGDAVARKTELVRLGAVMIAVPGQETAGDRQ